jgi:RNA polymerase subunit RPABC4/transcription elongation factor Spt4
MAEKQKACKECGFITIEKECSNCGSKVFLEKYKGRVAIIESKDSVIAQKLNLTSNGKFAIKYGN